MNPWCYFLVVGKERMPVPMSIEDDWSCAIIVENNEQWSSGR